MSKNHNQSGSAHLAIVAVLSIALIGTLGFVFWQNYSKSNDSKNASQSNVKTDSNGNVISPIKTTNDKVDALAVAPVIDDSEAAILVGNFYSSYNSIWGDPSISEGNTKIGAIKALVNNYGTDNFVTSYNRPTNMDNAVCSQQYFGSQIITAHKVEGEKAIVTVKQSVIYIGDFYLTVGVVNDNGLKIDSITCPVNY